MEPFKFILPCKLGKTKIISAFHCVIFSLVHKLLNVECDCRNMLLFPVLVFTILNFPSPTRTQLLMPITGTGH